MVQHPRQGHPAVHRLLTAAGAAALLWASCAKEGFPPGGPEDKTPPRVMTVSPADGSTGADTVRAISVEFSERVERKTAEEALYVMPSPAAPLRFRWRGTRLTAVLPVPPAKNRTYIVTVGAAVTDLRGNAMDGSFIAAFATGDSLDCGAVRGTVRDTALAGCAAVVWAVPADSMDGLLPAAGPAYVTQAGSDGAFMFRYMAAGTYRLLAFDDRNRDGVPDVGREALGGTDRDVPSRRDTTGTDAELVIASLDTVAPQPVRAVRYGGRRAEVAFSVPVAKTASEASVVLRTHGGGPFPAVTLRPGVPDGFSLTAVTAEPVPAGTCTVTVAGVAAAYGPAMPGPVMLPVWPEPDDTARPLLAGTVPRSGARGTHPDAPLFLTFSLPMDTAAVPAAVLTDTLTGNPVACSSAWDGGTRLRMRPERPLAGRACYRVRLPLAECLALNGRYGADTTVEVRFTTVADDTLGGLYGRVRGAPGGVPVRVVARRTDGRNRKGAGTAVVRTASPDGTFAFARMLPGTYELYAFADTDRDGRHGTASVRPFRPMEPLTFAATPVAVRPMWDTEGIMLVFPGTP